MLSQNLEHDPLVQLYQLKPIASSTELNAPQVRRELICTIGHVPGIQYQAIVLNEHSSIKSRGEYHTTIKKAD